MNFETEMETCGLGERTGLGRPHESCNFLLAGDLPLPGVFDGERNPKVGDRLGGLSSGATVGNHTMMGVRFEVVIRVQNLFVANWVPITVLKVELRLATSFLCAWSTVIEVRLLRKTSGVS